MPRSGSADVDQTPDPQALPAQATVDRVYATLRKGILDGTYVQGTRLGEVDQADSPEAVMRVHILSARPILLGAARDTRS